MRSRSWVAAAVLVLSSCGSSMVENSTNPPDTGEAPSTAAAPTDRASVLAAAALARVAHDNSFGGEDVFHDVAVVERLGHGTDDGMVELDADAQAWTADERAAVEQALAPRSVSWVASLETVIGTGPLLTSPPRLIAVVTMAVPVIDGDKATVTSSLWCGGTCGVGGTHTFSRDAHGAWAVTGTTGGGFIS